MHTLPQHLWVPLGAILAALIGGMFSFLALVISKENKVSELRQNWIDELRQEMAEFLASIRMVEYKTRVLRMKHKGKPIPPEEQEQAISEHYEPGLIAVNEILLILNPKGRGNSLSQKLVTEIGVIQEAYKNNKHAEGCAHAPKAREACQELLKFEWERVKEGERIYYWSKRAFALLVMICTILIVVLFAKQVFKPAEVRLPTADEIMKVMKAF